MAKAKKLVSVDHRAKQGAMTHRPQKRLSHGGIAHAANSRRFKCADCGRVYDWTAEKTAREIRCTCGTRHYRENALTPRAK